MEALLLIGLVLLAVLALAVAMYGLRFEAYRRVLPPWIPGGMLVIVLGLLIFALVTARWLNVVGLALTAIVFGVLLFDALRKRRSAGR